MTSRQPTSALVRELPPLGADYYYQRLHSLGEPAWLDSGQGPGMHILVGGPRETLDLAGDATDFDRLRQLAAQLDPIEGSPELPFCGGLVGYFGYEINHRLHKLNAPPPGTALGRFGLYDWALLIDSSSAETRLVFHPGCDGTRRRAVEEQLTAKAPAPLDEFRLLSAFEAGQSRREYEQRVARIVDYLLEGDCYQVNLSQAFTAPFEGNLLQPYLALRRRFGAPHGALLEFTSGALMSFSPERFLQVEHNRVETWPIKGTAPRHTDPEKDRQAANQLLHSEKNRAENLMIVDLMRNDLSQVCRPGSISAPDLHQLHSFALVHHLVSRVQGELAPGRDVFDLYRACLPGGSITGAPKRRAMQIIDELEDGARGPYCGSVAYFSCCGKSDSSIAIRTFHARGNQLEMRGGGAVVVDSQAAQEYQETLDKVSGYMHLLEQEFSTS